MTGSGRDKRGAPLGAPLEWVRIRDTAASYALVAGSVHWLGTLTLHDPLLWESLRPRGARRRRVWHRGWDDVGHRLELLAVRVGGTLWDVLERGPAARSEFTLATLAIFHCRDTPLLEGRELPPVWEGPVQLTLPPLPKWTPGQCRPAVCELCRPDA